MSREERTSHKNAPVSPGNWMWSIILSYIPGVNILFYIITAIGSRKTSKRKWAAAHLLWCLIIAAILVGVYFLFKDTVTAFLETCKDFFLSLQVKD